MRISISFIVLSIVLSYGSHADGQDSAVLRRSGFAGRSAFAGRVTDEANGTPLQGATIYIEDVKSGASSNKNGDFNLRNVPAGRHLVEVSFVGYATVTTYVDISGETIKNFSLHTSVVENNEVVVTGVNRASQIRRTPTPVSVVRKQDLLQSVSTNLIDALSRQPGISQVSSGPAISKPVIRGLGYNRVVVINDGVRQEGQQWGDEHGIEVDEYSVSKVEILKGPASLIYGSDAMAGVVNIITNVPVPDGTYKGALISNYQTNNRLRGFGGNISGNQNGFNWNAYGSLKAAEDYRNKYDGRVFNSKYSERNFGGYAGYNNSWGHVHVIFSSFNQRPGIIEGTRDSSGRFTKALPGGVEAIPSADDYRSTSPLIPKQEIQHAKVALEALFRLSKGDLTLNAGYQDNQRIEYSDPDAPEEKQLYFDLKTITYGAIYHFAQVKGWSTSLGVSGMSQHNENKGVEFLIPAYQLADIGGFVYTQRNFDKLTVSGGARYDNRTINTDALVTSGNLRFKELSRSFGNFSGSAGLSYLLSAKTTLKLNVSHGFRSPSVSELSSNGAHEGTNRYEYGQRDLQSENSWQVDAGVEVNTTHLTFNASVFNNHVNRFIFYQKLKSVSGGDSLVMSNGRDIPAYQYSQRTANLAGFECNVDVHPHPLDWLHFENTFSLVAGRFADPIEGTRNMPLIPASRLISELRGDFLKKGNVVRNFSIHAECDINFAQSHPFYAYGTETSTPAYVLLNAGISADVRSHDATLFSVYLSALNLGDVAYQNHLSRLKYTDQNLVTGRQGVFNMGRNFSLKINVPFSFEAKSKTAKG